MNDESDKEDHKRLCRWCGNDHGRLCPYVKALEFAESNGRITRVEFLTPNDIPPALRAAPQESEPTYPRLSPLKE